VVEDGPTLTHGGMAYGAGMLAAKNHRAKIIDPRRYAVGSIRDVYRQYPHLKNVLPAMGYSAVQVRELEATINSIPCDAVISGTPIYLRRIIRTAKPIVRIRYDLKIISTPNLYDVLKPFYA
jgi:predicted GTPase